MLSRAAVLAATTALALPATAAAKEISSLAVCGPAHCHTITARAALHGFIEGGYETLAPPRGGAFYAVKARITHEGEDAGSFTVQYLPALNLVRAEAEFHKHRWLRPSGVTARALRRAARGLRPYPAAKLGLVRPPSPAPAGSPPARVSGSARGDGAVRLGIAGGAGALVLVGAVLLFRRRHST
jgi:hypothetical protein